MEGSDAQRLQRNGNDAGELADLFSDPPHGDRHFVEGRWRHLLRIPALPLNEVPEGDLVGEHVVSCLSLGAATAAPSGVRSWIRSLSWLTLSTCSVSCDTRWDIQRCDHSGLGSTLRHSWMS
jgi:hypothetical protein